MRIRGLLSHIVERIDVGVIVYMHNIGSLGFGLVHGISASSASLGTDDLAPILLQFRHQSSVNDEHIPQIPSSEYMIDSIRLPLVLFTHTPEIGDLRQR